MRSYKTSFFTPGLFELIYTHDINKESYDQNQTNSSLSIFARPTVDFCCQLHQVFWPTPAMRSSHVYPGQLLMFDPFQEF